MMSGFLYYLPESTTRLGVVDLAGRGLGYAFERGREVHKRDVNHGPDGQAGGLITHLPAAECLYLPDRQQWRRVPATSAWVGWYADRPMPGPEDLLRGETMAGHEVRLGDGRAWTTPAVRRIEDRGDHVAHYASVAHAIDWDEAGNRIYGEVVPGQRKLWEAATAWFNAKVSAETTEERVELIERSLAEEYALIGLSTNYRLWKAEAGALALLDDRSEIAVLDALIDWPSWERYLKKNAARGGLSGEPGRREDCPAIDQP